jgi:hypothetical protein
MRMMIFASLIILAALRKFTSSFVWSFVTPVERTGINCHVGAGRAPRLVHRSVMSESAIVLALFCSALKLSLNAMNIYVRVAHHGVMAMHLPICFLESEAPNRPMLVI